MQVRSLEALVAVRSGQRDVGDLGLRLPPCFCAFPAVAGAEITAGSAPRTRLRAPATVGAAGPVDDPADLPAARFVMRTPGAYFATGQSLVASAKRLHIHPNTVTQRLDRVKRLLGKDWNSPDHTLEVQLALRLHRLARDLDG